MSAGKMKTTASVSGGWVGVSFEGLACSGLKSNTPKMSGEFVE